MMTGQPIKVWSLSTTPRSGFRNDRALTIRKRKKKAEPSQSKPLGGRARGVDERGAQAVEEDRRRERPLQVGEEVDDVEAALDQVAQIVGGESDGFGRALLAVSDQVADDRQAPDQGEIEQPEIAVDGAYKRRPGAVDEPFRRHLDQTLDDLLDGNLATVILVGRLVDLGNRQGVDPGLEGRRDHTLGELPALVAIEPGLDGASARARARSVRSPGDGGRSTRTSASARARTRRCCD